MGQGQSNGDVESGAAADKVELSNRAQPAAADLHRAVREENPDLNYVQSLLDEGADPKEYNEEGRNALHHACRCECTSEKLLTLLLEKDHDGSLINAVDEKNNTALGYAVKYRNSTAALILLDKKADFRRRGKYTDNNGETHEGDTLLHEACLNGLSDVVAKMLYIARDNPVTWKGLWNTTPLHAACKGSHLIIAKQLVAKEADPKVKDDNGKTPLYAACSGVKVDETTETVEYLLENGAMAVLNDKSSEGESSLSIACSYGQYDTVELLLDKGAIVHRKCMEHAVEKGFSFTAKRLLQSPQWQMGLRQTIHGDPIMNEIIRKMPDIASEVLDKCTVKSTKRTDDDLCVAFNFEFLEPFKEKGSSFFDEKQEAENNYVDSPKENALLQARKDIQKKEKQYQDVIKQRKKSFGPNWGVKKFKKSLHPLAVMVESKNYELLTHPVVRALLHHKWWPYGFMYDLTNLVIFLAFLIFTTSLSLSVETPFSQECPAQGNGTCGVPMSRQTGVKFTASMAIVFAAIRLLIRLVKELILMLKLREKYCTSFHLFEWVDVPCYVLSISFASVIFTNNCPCPSTSDWQLGIAGLFLSWITFLKYLNKLPEISNYVLMLWRIVVTFVKVAISIGIPLILTFAWPFFMALHDPGVSRSPFQNPFISITKVLSMTTGSFDFDNTFRRDSSGESDFEEELPFLPVTYILWITFVILMPVLLNNLLVGLAIGDIHHVEEAAKLRNLVLKVELVLGFEEFLPTSFRRWLRTGYRVVHPCQESKLCFGYFKRKKHEFESYENLHQIDERKKASQGEKAEKNQMRRMEDLLQRVAEKMDVL